MDIDAAGEDCRQRLDRVRMKVEVFEEVLLEMKKLLKDGKVILGTSKSSQ